MLAPGIAAAVEPSLTRRIASSLASTTATSVPAVFIASGAPGIAPTGSAVPSEARNSATGPPGLPIATRVPSPDTARLGSSMPKS